MTRLEAFAKASEIDRDARVGESTYQHPDPDIGVVHSFDVVAGVHHAYCQDSYEECFAEIASQDNSEMTLEKIAMLQQQIADLGG